MSSDRSGAGPRPSSGFAPCFPVRDVQAALAHYERLGFDVMPFEDGMEWAWVRFGAAELHLFLKRDHDPNTTAAAADLMVDDVDELERGLERHGSERNERSLRHPVQDARGRPRRH